MKAEDIMNKRVIYFSPENTILEISKKFAEYNISGAPIVENKKVVGIICNSDIIKFINENVYKDATEINSTTSSIIINLLHTYDKKIKFKKEVEKILNTKVRDIMIKDVKLVKPETDFLEVVEIMIKHGINRIPVIDDNGEIVGIITRDDVIKGIAKNKSLS
jgi:CBS domain-containing protein